MKGVKITLFLNDDREINGVVNGIADLLNIPREVCSCDKDSESVHLNEVKYDLDKIC